MKKNLLLVAALASAMCVSAATPVASFVDIDALTAAGIVGDGDNTYAQPEGSTGVLIDNEYGTLGLAPIELEVDGVKNISYALGCKAFSPTKDYNMYSANGGASAEITMGVTGDGNPSWPGDQLASYPSGGGWVYKFDAKQTGTVTFFTKANSNKQYYVFLANSPVGYNFAMTVGGQEFDKILYTLPSLPNGLLNLNDADINKYYQKSTNAETGEETVNTTRLGTPGSIQGCGNVGEGTGIVQFPVFAGRTYYVCAAGSKMCTNGFIFCEGTEYPKFVVSYEKTNDETGEVTSASVNLFEGEAGIDNITIGQPALDENAPVYNLKGQVVDKATKGEILIQNGKKFINL